MAQQPAVAGGSSRASTIATAQRPRGVLVHAPNNAGIRGSLRGGASVLRLVLASDPAWARAIAAQGSGGAGTTTGDGLDCATCGVSAFAVATTGEGGGGGSGDAGEQAAAARAHPRTPHLASCFKDIPPSCHERSGQAAFTSRGSCLALIMTRGLWNTQPASFATAIVRYRANR